MSSNNEDRIPLITIAISCYNAQDTIRRAVRSAIQQTWRSREIIIVDDCSTDGSWAIIQDFVQQFPELRAFRHERNRGIAAAQKSLLAEAHGEFIAFFDDDDESVIDRLERQYERITVYEMAHGNPPVFCYSNRNVVPVGDTKPRFQRFGIGRTSPEPHGIIVADYFLGGIADSHHCWGMSGTCTLMARTATLRRVGGYDDRFRRCAETDIIVRGAFEGAHFISVDAPLLTQYITDTPDKAEAILLRYKLLALSKHKAYLDSKKAYPGAVANLRASFNHSRERRLRGWLWRALALALFPRRISWSWLTARRYRKALPHTRAGGYI